MASMSVMMTMASARSSVSDRLVEPLARSQIPAANSTAVHATAGTSVNLASVLEMAKHPPMTVTRYRTKMASEKRPEPAAPR